MHIKSLLLSVSLLLPLSANAFNVFACEPEYAHLAERLLPSANVYSATTSRQDPHMVQARPSLIAKFRRADIAICAGASLEIGWLPMLQLKANNAKLRKGNEQMFFAYSAVDTLDKLESVGFAAGDVHKEGNPHFHLSPTRIPQIVDALAQLLAKESPEDKSEIEKNRAAFQAEWSEAMKRWEVSREALKGMNVIGYHSSYRYIFDWLEINQVADLEPKPGIPPSSSHLAKLINTVKSQDVKLIVHTSYQNGDGAQWLGEKTNTPYSELAYTVDEERTSLIAVYDRIIEQLLVARQQ